MSDFPTPRRDPEESRPGRRGIEGLGTPYPLATLLPGVLQEDDFLVRLATGLDDVLAPAVSVVDCLEAYLDPRTAPDDFLAWLADWVGAPLDAHWTQEQRRSLVLGAAALHRLRGTTDGVRAMVALATHGEVEVVEYAGVTWSTSPTEDPHLDQPGELVIRIAVDHPESLRPAALEELVLAVKPAHLPHRIEVKQR